MIRNNQRRIKKESGYALIIVLLVITVFSVLGLTVMSVSLNHTKQFSKETTQTQALNVAEMGLKAYNKELKTKIASVTGVTEQSFKQKLSEDVLPDSLNSSSDSSLSSMQGNPSYTVTHGEVDDPTDNKIIVTITSEGTSGGDTQTITQTKTFEFRSGSNGGDSGNGSNDNELDLPSMDGALIMGTSENGDLLYPTNPSVQADSIDRIFIAPNTQKSVGATFKTDVPDFQSKLEQINNIIKANTTLRNIVAQIPNQVPQIPGKPSAPSNWTVANATQNTSYDMISNYANNTNFTQDWIHAKGSDGVTFEHSVSVKNLIIDTGTNVTIKGDLYVQGNLEVNSNLKVEGNTYINGGLLVNTTGLNVNFLHDVYVGQKITLNSKTSFGGNVSADDISINDTRADAIFGANVYSNKDILINAVTSITDNAYTKGKFTVNNTSADTTIGGYLYSGGETTFNANTTITNNVYSVGRMTINPGRLVIHGNAFTGGDLTMNTTVDIDHNLYVTGKIDVNSNNNVNDKIHVGGDIFSGRDFIINDEIEVNGSIYASGKMTLNSNGITTIGNKLYTGGELVVNDSLTLAGNAYANSNVTINGDGRADFDGYFFVNSDITSNSPNDNSGKIPASRFDRTVYVKGNAKFQQNKPKSSDNENALNFQKGLVVNNSANLYTANESGTIRIGLLSNNDGSSSGENSGSSGQSPIVLINTETKYN